MTEEREIKEQGQNPPTTPAPAAHEEEHMNMADLLKSDGRDEHVEFSKGDIFTGEVLHVSHDFVFLNVGSKMDGKIPKSEFTEIPKAGDKVEAAFISVNRESGDLLLSKTQAQTIKVYSNLHKAIDENDSVIEGTVLSKKGEFYKVDIGIPVEVKEKEFINRIDDVKKVIGQTLKFKISKFIENKNVIFMSRRAYLYELREKQRKGLLENLQVGKKVKGIVKDMKPYGVFVDLGGIDGFIYINDLSWGRNPVAENIVKKGEEIEVLILAIEDRKTEEPKPEDDAKSKEKDKFKRKDTIKISLGYKQLKPNPWTEVEHKYQVGMIVKGKVVNIFDYGAFIELEEGIDAFARKEDISWSRHLKTPKKLMKIGEMVQAKISAINVAEKKISLNLKELLPNPWEAIKKKYHIGEKIKGKIVKVIERGAFVQLDENIDGFISIDNISWTDRVNRASDHFQAGQDVEAVIIDIKPEEQKINLGIKQFTSNPWEVFMDKTPENTIVNGKIARFTRFGMFVTLENGLDGFIHQREVDKEKAEKMHEHFKVGDDISAVVLRIEPATRRIDLSIRNYDNVVQSKEVEKYMNDNEATTVKLGSFLKFKPLHATQSEKENK